MTIQNYDSPIINYEYDYEKKKKKLEKSLIKIEPPNKPTKIDAKEVHEFITKEEIGMNRGLFRKHFSFQIPTVILKVLYNKNDKKKNNDLINVIKIGLIDLKDEIEKMSEN